MRLTDIPAVVLADTLRTWRRRLIVGGLAAACGLVAVAEGLSAARLALEPAMGPVGARLILTAAFAAVIAAGAAFLFYAERRDAAARAVAAKPFGGDQKVAVIAEAIHLGYSLARDFRQARADREPAPKARARACGPKAAAGLARDRAAP